MAKPIYFNHKNREFKVFAVPSCGGGLADVHIYEYHPNRKILKWSYCDTFSMWVEDFDTIEEGCRAKLAKFLNEEADRIAIAKKWEEFEKKY